MLTKICVTLAWNSRIKLGVNRFPFVYNYTVFFGKTHTKKCKVHCRLFPNYAENMSRAQLSLNCTVHCSVLSSKCATSVATLGFPAFAPVLCLHIIPPEVFLERIETGTLTWGGVSRVFMKFIFESFFPPLFIGHL